jgi:signal transduction histidine kinase
LGVVFKIDGGPWVTASHSERPNHNFTKLVVGIAVFTSLLLIGAFFVSCRITGRLERLQRAVSKWGGESSPEPVAVEGHDEVASLSISFNEAAERINRLLEGQRNILASASHELRTPLARIRVAAEILATSKNEDSRQNSLDEINADIEELDDLVADILMAARLDAHPLRDEENETIDLLELSQRLGKSYDAKVTGEPLSIIGNRLMLKRMLTNLLDNSMKYAQGAAPEITISKVKEFAVINVMDRGPGIGELDKERLFDPFYRGAGNGDTTGYGLGLALVSKITQRHGGSAAYHSREDGGANFEIRLPVN